MQTSLSIQSCYYILSFSSEQDGYKTELVPFFLGGGGGGHTFIIKKGGLCVKRGSSVFLSGVRRVCGYCPYSY